MNLIECNTCGRWDEVDDQKLRSVFERLGFGNFVCHSCAVKAMTEA